MASKKSRPTYTSKGQRRCVARKTLNAMRRDRRENPSIDSLFQASDHRRLVLGRPKDKNLAILYKKYVEEDRVNSRAEDLFKSFKSAGVTWAACVQAVKTDYIAQLEMKFGRAPKTKEKTDK